MIEYAGPSLLVFLERIGSRAHASSGPEMALGLLEKTPHAIYATLHIFRGLRSALAIPQQNLYRVYYRYGMRGLVRKVIWASSRDRALALSPVLLVKVMRKNRLPAFLQERPSFPPGARTTHIAVHCA